ncbi:MAG: hypothetical protein ACFFCS_27910 [Candidatus Hodarchaeota archaeon]
MNWTAMKMPEGMDNMEYYLLLLDEEREIFEKMRNAKTPQEKKECNRKALELHEIRERVARELLDAEDI